MPKNKPHRKAPSIDMTAMCDVAFLLLTFFMLTAKAKPPEAVTVDTPSSISETKVPDAGTLTITVSKDGKTFLDMAGTHTRKLLIDNMDATYQLNLTEEEKVKFAGAGAFGCKRDQLKLWLSKTPTERNTMVVPGIPSDTVDNELGPWVHNARLAQFKKKQEGTVQDEYVIVIKADQSTPFPAVQKVLHTLNDISVNKFNLITSMEGDPSKAKKEGN
jgi:biopolymer transport protein ExbD